MGQSRRTFIEKTIALTGSLLLGSRFSFGAGTDSVVMTVNGPVPVDKIGTTLIHEHILVDFIGAKEISFSRWDRKEVARKMLPFLSELKAAGAVTLVDCTPNYLGRDAVLLKELSGKSGLNIVTNTGYYGGSDNKYLPAHTFTESPEQLAARWVEEWNSGIDGTGVKPGFIKISVNDGSLSDVSKKLITAAAMTHLQSGLTIASHTGPFVPALQQVEILEKLGVDPSAFIWVHAQNEKDPLNYVELAKRGAWVSLDGLSDSNIEDYIDKILFMKENNCLHRTLVSHDAGWYDPAKPDGGEIRGYTTLLKKFVPTILKKGFTQKRVDQLLKINPAEGFRIRQRLLKK